MGYVKRAYGLNAANKLHFGHSCLKNKSLPWCCQCGLCIAHMYFVGWQRTSLLR